MNRYLFTLNAIWTLLVIYKFQSSFGIASQDEEDLVNKLKISSSELEASGYMGDEIENENETSLYADNLEYYHCHYVPNQRISNRTEELECCEYMITGYYGKWFYGRAYLTTFLDNLKQWECPQLERQCRKRYFDVSAFTNLVYNRVCDQQKYRNECFETVSNLQTTNLSKFDQNFSLTTISDARWQEMVRNLYSMNMTYEEINQPCTQVALFEGPRGGPGRYHESVEVMVPFCGFVWCGYDADTIHGRKISVWTCMPTGCKIGMGIAALLIACLGILTLLANLMVIAVYWYKKNMNNSQTVYRVTLAIGDTLVGAVVFPTFISSLFLLFLTRLYMGDYVKPMKNESINGIPLQPQRYPIGHFRNAFTQPYLDGVGFFTSFSIIISVYTLMLASFDRMAAMSCPMSYDRRRARNIAKHTCAILCLAALVVAVLPIFTSSLRYGLVASILISLLEGDAVIFYTITMIIPLVLMWITTIILLVYSKRHTQVRRQISTRSNDQITISERRLVKTLSIMVGSFTASLLPAIIVLLISMFVDDIYYDDPEYLSKTSATIYTTSEFVSVVILSTNSLWNFFIYNSRDKDFRKSAKHLLNKNCSTFGFPKMWRTMKYRITKRRLTAASITTGVISIKTCSELEKQASKNTAPNSTESLPEENNSRGKIDNNNEEPNFDPNEDSTWRSFAVSEGNGFYRSVMENIAVNIEEDGRIATTKQ
uniref:uncharacterized protein LOC120331068 n=1 Tax=Styela clava TaxID=7725 RepID=UPI00193AC654|nr:uncharacterized protein LOC120331068 [Styela clava]